jgi:hypothetical protein
VEVDISFPGSNKRLQLRHVIEDRLHSRRFGHRGRGVSCCGDHACEQECIELEPCHRVCRPGGHPYDIIAKIASLMQMSIAADFEPMN